MSSPDVNTGVKLKKDSKVMKTLVVSKTQVFNNISFVLSYKRYAIAVHENDVNALWPYIRYVIKKFIFHNIGTIL